MQILFRLTPCVSQRGLVAGLIGLATLAIGCGGPAPSPANTSATAKSEDSTSTTPSTPGESSSEVNAPDAKSDVTLRVTTYDELQKTIAKHKGKIVVCDYWSTSCEPCVREFPGLIKLSQAHPEKVVCISASLDFDGLNPIDTYKKPVLEFLTKQKANIDNVLFSEEDTTVYEKLKIASIPAVFVYGADGERKKLFDESSGKEFTYEKDIIPFVDELVKAP